MKCARCEDCGWVCEDHPSDRGRARTRAHVAALGCLAHGAIRAMRITRHGCHAALQTMTMPRVTESSWSRKFDEPIPLAKGRQLVTLMDAGTYITNLPKAEHMAAEWQAAMEALILVATLGGPTMFARIGIMRALNRHVERVFNHDRKEHHWGKRKLARDR
jgi:hypothetical protein